MNADSLRILARNWLLIIAVTVGAAALAGYLNAKRAPVYEATSTVFVQPNDTDKPGDVNSLYPLQNSGLIPTFADMVSSDATLLAASRSVGTTDVSRYSVAAKVLPQSFGVSVSVRGPDAVGSAAVNAAVLSVARKRFSDAYAAYAVTPLSLPASAGRRSSVATPAAATTGGLLGAVATSLLVLVTAAIRRPVDDNARGLPTDQQLHPRVVHRG